MTVDLKAEVALEDETSHVNVQPHWKSMRSPAYKRRQERRQAARIVAEEAMIADVKKEAVKLSSSNAGESVVHCGGLTEQVTNTENIIKEADKFPCRSCDFVSNWENGLEAHMKISHVESMQTNSSIVEKYESTAHYWKTGHLGTVYRRFLDANDIIDGLMVSEEWKLLEKNKVLEARKAAFNPGNWRNFPPWSG